MTDWMPFNVHDTSNTTPRAQLGINTGGNSSGCLLEPVDLDFQFGRWAAVFEDESLGMTFRGEGSTANGAMLSLLAARLGILAQDVSLSDESPFRTEEI